MARSSGDHGHEPLFPFLREMEILPEWDAAAARFLATGGVAMVLGGTDTGKSTLSRYLVYYLFSRGRKVALVDLDLGQSHLGPPAALGLGLFPPLYPGDDSLFPSGLYFIGATSPAGVLLEVVVGCRVLVEEALKGGADHVVINTCGFIHGPVAHRLKRAKLEVLRPQLLLGLERQGELARLHRALTGGRDREFLLLPVSPRARGRTPEERRQYREGRWRRYFAGARELVLPWSAVGWQGLPWGTGQPLGADELRHYQLRMGSRVLYGETDGSRAYLLLAHPPREDQAGQREGEVRWVTWSGLAFTLMGLLDAGHHTLALGLLLPSTWEEQKLTLLTPLPAWQADQVRFIRVGRQKVSPNGKELAGGS